MRKRRLKVSGALGVYHLMSRTAGGLELFGEAEKEVLRRLIHRAAGFSGVRVLTYCVMSNHFHILAAVEPVESLSDEELVRRYRLLYGEEGRYRQLGAGDLAALLASGGPLAGEVRAGLLARMGDVSEFMKTLKQRFGMWFNRNRGRYGTLWAERFKSLLVEAEEEALKTVAAYIDLNPVRAGLAEDPGEYRWCGYAEALGGSREAREGLRWVTGSTRPLPAYRMLLFGKGSAPGKPGAKTIDAAAASAVIEQRRGSLPLPVLLRCRLRYLCDGIALGSEPFVRDLAGPLQGERKRPLQPQELPGAAGSALRLLGNLRARAFG